jgi:hypothetical protein
MRLSAEDDRKSVLAHVFADVKWECPQILAAMMNVSDICFDRVSQIRMDQWARGRTALVGDAAACVSLLAGESTGLAMAEAYVLAAALRDCGGDHVAAIARYQESLMPFLRRKQESAARFASSFVPKTALGIAYRNVVTRLDTWRVVEFNVHHDPAPAICLLVSLYRMRNQQVIVVGLGRELAEAALLRQVEIPIVVRHDSIDQALLMRELPSAYRTSAEALDGWREAVFGIAGE